jgi:hypothetical protein
MSAAISADYCWMVKKGVPKRINMNENVGTVRYSK